MTNIDSLAADAEASKEVRKNTLSLAEVCSLCAEMAAQEKIVSRLEENLELEKEKLDKYAEEIIPDALIQIGLKNLTLDDGTEIGLTDLVAASISEANRPAAHLWLRDNGYGDIIKNVVTVEFGKDEDSDAEHLLTAIKAMDGLNYGALERQEKVHASTLKAFVKDRIKNGEEIPADIFGLYLGQKAVVEKKRKKK